MSCVDQQDQQQLLQLELSALAQAVTDGTLLKETDSELKVKLWYTANRFLPMAAARASRPVLPSGNDDCTCYVEKQVCMNGSTELYM